MRSRAPATKSARAALPSGPRGSAYSTRSRIVVEPHPASNAWVWRQKEYGPDSCSSTKQTPGSQRVMRVRQRNGTPKSESAYSMRAPAHIATGFGVRMRKRRNRGVITSRFDASEKKAKTSSLSAGMIWARSRMCVRFNGTAEYPDSCCKRRSALPSCPTGCEKGCRVRTSLPTSPAAPSCRF